MYHGVLLFNALPPYLRRIISKVDPAAVDELSEHPSFPEYKGDLDKFLEGVPDQPFSQRDQRLDPRTAKSNGLVHQLETMPREWWQDAEKEHMARLKQRKLIKQLAAAKAAKIDVAKKATGGKGFAPSRWDN